MNQTKLNKAVAEAREFIKRADALTKDHQGSGYFFYFFPSKLSGAVRRQSMELTRALSELRKPN